MKFSSSLMVLLIAVIAGCTNYSSLRTGEYDRVEPSLLAEAGDSGNHELVEPIAKLLMQRLNNAKSVTDEQAIEACIAIGKLNGKDHSDLLLKLVMKDASSDVRFFSANALKQVDQSKFNTEYDSIIKAQQDEFILKHLQQLKNK